MDAHNYWLRETNEKVRQRLDINGHDEDGGGPCHTHLMAKERVRGFVVGFFGEVSSDILTLVRHCVDMIAYRVWKRSGFSSVSECCGVLGSFTLEQEIDDLLFAWRGTVDSQPERMKVDLVRQMESKKK